jgi:hypothetical protein
MSKDTQHHKPEDAHVEGHHGIEETIIVAPKGGSKVRFLMTFLLVLLLLTTFSVSDEVVACFTRSDSATKGYMSWNDPTDGTKHIRTADFITEKQILAKFWAIMQGRNDRDRNDEDTASFLVLSDLSEEAGVRVTDSDLKARIVKSFGSSDTYKAMLQAHRISPKEFEETLRRVLRVERYLAMLSEGLGTPDPTEVEKVWQGRHQEYAFDYIELPSANLTNDAAGLAPTGDALKAWFDALPDVDREKYKTLPQASAELAGISLEGDVKTDLLFAKYPRPADENAEEAARDFYAGFGYARYRKTNFKPEEIKKIEDLNEPFDSVKDIAARDARIYRSLSTWQADLVARETKGETIDFKAEAEKLGLVYYRGEKLESQADWEKLEGPCSGRYVVEAIFSTPAGKFLPSVQVETKAFVLGRVLAKEEAAYPPFAELEPKVREAWVKKKAAELAVAKLEALRDKFGTRPDPTDASAPSFKPEADAEKFAAAAKEAGYEVKHRDYEEHYAKIVPDKMTPAEAYLRNASQLYVLKVDSVDRAGQSTDGAEAFLVRVAGVRDPDASKMSPAELQSISKQLSDQAMLTFRTSTFKNIEFLKERYGLDMESWRREKKAPN